MPSVELHATIWAHITLFVKQPKPRLRCDDRSAIRQPDLASLMRVSKEMNTIIGPILYEIVITDHLPSLTYGLHRRSAAAKGIPSKAELLSFTRRLFLEYCSKDEPTYSELMHFGGQRFSLFIPSENEMTSFCHTEVDWVKTELKKLWDLSKRMISVSTGAYLDTQRDIWEGTNTEEGGMLPCMINAQKALEALVISPHYTYVCQRVEYGPLAFPPIFLPSEETRIRDRDAPQGIEFRGHFEGYIDTCPIIMGTGHARWYYPVDYSPRGGAAKAALQMLQEALYKNIKDRKGCWDLNLSEPMGRWLRESASTPIDIYLPQSLMIHRGRIKTAMAAARKRAAKEGAATREARSEDIYRLLRADTSPVCEACGWSVEDLVPAAGDPVNALSM